MTEWFADGESRATIPVDDRAVQYGDGVFETIAVRDNVPRLWGYHADRLATACARLGIDAPDLAALERDVDGAIEKSSADSTYATAKIIVSAGSGPRGYRRPDARASVFIGLSDGHRLPASSYADGVAARMCNTRLAIQPQLAGIKSLNRLEQVLARNEWNDDSVFDGVTLDTDGRIICGTMSNVFLFQDNRLVTPAITRCGVSGVMRRHVLTVAGEAGIDCDVRDVLPGEIGTSDGMMLTNSLIGAVPVREIDGRELGIAATAKILQGLLRESGVMESGA